MDNILLFPSVAAMLLALIFSHNYWVLEASMTPCLTPASCLKIDLKYLSLSSLLFSVISGLKSFFGTCFLIENSDFVWGVVSVRALPRMCKALGSVSGTTKMLSFTLPFTWSVFGQMASELRLCSSQLQRRTFSEGRRVPPGFCSPLFMWTLEAWPVICHRCVSV